MIFLSLNLPHFGHFRFGDSLNFWMNSERSPQSLHSYSYIGMSFVLWIFSQNVHGFVWLAFHRISCPVAHT